MKYLITLLFIAVLCCASYVQADEATDIKTSAEMKVISMPMAIAGGTSPLMTVIFNHKTHRKVGNNIACEQCHHESSTDTPYSSCSVECHNEPGARERDPMSMFMAFHSLDAERSCYGCHTSLAEKDPDKYPEFRNCRPCHISPDARKELDKQ